GSFNGAVKLWDVATRQEVAELQGHTEAVSFVAFLGNGKTLVTWADEIAADTPIKLWEVATGKELGPLPLKRDEHKVRCMALTGDGRTLATGSSWRWGFKGRKREMLPVEVKLWDVAAVTTAAR